MRNYANPPSCKGLCGTAGALCDHVHRRRLISGDLKLANWMVNFVVALTAPTFLRVSPTGQYFLFCGATLFTSVVCFFYMPETKGKNLEEIEDIFEKKAGSSELLD